MQIISHKSYEIVDKHGDTIGELSKGLGPEFVLYSMTDTSYTVDDLKKIIERLEELNG